MNLDYLNDLDRDIKKKEQYLGRGLFQPYANTNSGSRKILNGAYLDQRLNLINPQLAFLSTGYEHLFGENSSSYNVSLNDMKVLYKISKFKDKPNHHYYLLLHDEKKNELHMIERISYQYITETYGYLIDNNYLDSLIPMKSYINKGDVYQKSTSTDKYNNRIDGINIPTAYMSYEMSIEDGIILSDEVCEQLASPLLKKVQIIINDNDILLNMYGDNEKYKAFPMIGESIKNNILCGMRREKKEEALYSQSYNRLSELMMSDERLTLNGEIIDIDIMCNNNNIDPIFYNEQLISINENSLRYQRELVELVDQIRKDNPSITVHYILQKLYYNFHKIINGGQYIKEKVFSNIILEFMVLEKNKVNIGDKITDRYGGKGTVGEILPKEAMPILDNGTVVGIIKNQNTCFNRENLGQLFELSQNHMGERIVEVIASGALSDDECVELLYKFYRAFEPRFAEEFMNMINRNTDNPILLKEYLNSIVEAGGIHMAVEPLSSEMSIDKISDVYDMFPWITQNDYLAPMINSRGILRHVPARRPIVSGNIYVYRLKQYAEEKFSATSLSSTNIKNENSRNKSNRIFKSTHARTPIRFGNMEITDLLHVGVEIVVQNLMIYSSSPQARRLLSKLLTNNPFEINITLDEESKNRSVEIVQAYLKTLGLKMLFIKKEKKLINPITIHPISIKYDNVPPYIKPIRFMDEEYEPYIVPIKIQPITKIIDLD